MRFYRGQTLSSYPKRIGGGSDDDGAADQPAVRADPHSVSPVMVEQAVQAAADIAKAGDIVFMSPASASFDMYKNFEERGKHFKALVTALSE